MSKLFDIRKLCHQSIGVLSSLVVGLSPITSNIAYAQQIQGSGTNAPDVLNTANGTPLVMINTPNATGVSHNTYSGFDVGVSGVILNNIDQNYGQTQQGGMVQGNNNLQGGAANLIINEVISNNPSKLNGYIEVGGQRANVVVANPYGITCDGCGFINTDYTTLTTGTPQFGEDGALQSINVSQGHVQIGERGLDATGVSQFDLLSRTVDFAGAIYGQNVRVVAGRNNIIYATGDVELRGDDGGEAPAIAIDSTVLGGMYADKITIMSTESGAGVRAPETMAANAGDMHITADGRLVMGKASAERVVVHSRTSDVEIRNRIYAAEQAEITAARDVVIAANGQLVAESAITVGAKRDIVLHDKAVIGARGDDVNVEAGRALILNAGATIVAEAGKIDMQARELMLDSGAVLSAQNAQWIDLAQGADLGVDAKILAGGDLVFVAQDIHAGRGAQIVAGDSLAVTVSESITLSGARLQATHGDLYVKARALSLGIDSSDDASVAGMINGGGAVWIETQEAYSTIHDISAAGSLNLDLGVATLGDGSIVGGNGATITGKSLSIGGMTGTETGDLEITTTSGDLVTTHLASAGDIMIDSARNANLGHIQATGDLEIDAAGGVSGRDVFKAGGLIDIATGESLIGLALHAGDDVVARAVGDILVGDDPALAGTALPHDQVETPDGSGDGASPDGGTESEADGEVAGQTGAAPALVSDGGVTGAGDGTTDGRDNLEIAPQLAVGDVWAGDDIDLTAGGRIVIGNSVRSGGNIAVAAGQLIDVELAEVGGALTFDSGIGQTRLGDLVVTGNFELDVAGDFELGEVSIPGRFILTSGSLTLDGVAAGGDLSLTATDGNIAIDGNVLTNGSISMNAARYITADTVVAESALAITAGDNIRTATLQSGGAMNVRADQALNVGGLIIGGSDVRLVTGTQITAEAVQALSGALILDAGTDIDVDQTITAEHAVHIVSGRDFSVGGLISETEVMINARRHITLHGDLSAPGLIHLIAGGRLTLVDGMVEDDSAVVIRSENNINISTDDLVTGSNAQIAAPKGTIDLDFTARATIGAGANLMATALDVDGDTMDLRKRATLSADQMTIALRDALSLADEAIIEAENGLTVVAGNMLLGDGSRFNDKGVDQTTVVTVENNATLDGATIFTAGQLDFSATALTLTTSATDRKSMLVATRNFDLAANTITADKKSVFQSNTASLDLRGQDGQLAVKGGLFSAVTGFTAEAGTLRFAQSAVISEGTAALASTTGGLNFDGDVEATLMTMQSAGMADIAGTLTSSGAITLTATGNLTHSSFVSTPAKLTLQAEDTLYDSGVGVVPGATPKSASNNLASLGNFTSQAGTIESEAIYTVAGDADIITTGGAFNNKGTIISGGTLTVIAAGTIINSHELRSRDLSLEAASLANSGLLVGAQNLTADIRGDIVNSGRIETDGGLALTAKGILDIQSGSRITAVAEGSSASFTAGKLRNAGSVSLLNGAVDIAGNIINSGKINANLTGDIGGILENSGTIDGGNYSLTATGLTNNGTINPQGRFDVDMRGGNLLNNGKIHSGVRIKVGNAGTLTNAVTGIIGNSGDAGQVSITSQVVNNAGEISSNDALSITASNITNNGDILSGGVLRVDVAGILRNQTDGVMQSAVSEVLSTIKAATIDNAGDIIADGGDLRVNASNIFSNSGKISGRGTASYVRIWAGQVPDIGGIAVEGTLEIANETGGLLDALTTADGQSFVTKGALVLKVKTLDNAGAIAGLDGLEIWSNHIDNTGLLYTDGDMTLRVANLIDNDGGAILIGDTLRVSGHVSDGTAGSYNELTKLTNHNGGSIQTVNGDMNFNVGTLENSRKYTVTTTPTESFFASDHGWSFCTYADSDCSSYRDHTDGQSHGDSTDIQNDSLSLLTTLRSITFGGQQSEIRSGSDIVFRGGHVLNTYSLISAGRNIDFGVDSVTNFGGDYGFIVDVKFEYDIDDRGDDRAIYRRGLGLSGTTYDPNGGGFGYVLESNPDIQPGVDVATAIRIGETQRYISIDGQLIDSHAMSTFSPDNKGVGYLSGEFTLSPSQDDHADFRSIGIINQVSAFGTIHAAGNITGQVNGYIENGAIKKFTTVDGANGRSIGSNSQAPINVGTFVFGGALIGGDAVVAPSRLSFTRINAANVGETMRVAPLTGSSPHTRLANAVVGTTNRAVVLQNGQINSNTGVSSPNATTPPQIRGRANINLGAIGRDNLFVVNQDPSTNYLVESRYEFIDQSAFTSSDYFLDQMDYDAAATQKRLGDGMVEAALIRDQIFNLTGRGQLNSRGSEAEQMQGLYQGAIDQTDALDLVPGVALNPAQVAALTRPIIWLEERVVSGQTVLVPQVYLTEATLRDNARGATQITGDAGLNIAADNVSNTGGAIGSANGRTQISALSSVENNYGEIFGGSNETIDVEGRQLTLPSVSINVLDGDYFSTGGTVVGDSGSVSANNILVETPAERIKNGSDFSDITGSAAGFDFADDLLLGASGNISLTGSDLNAGGNAYLNSGGDINLGALSLEARSGNTEGEEYNYTYQRRYETSDITAGGAIHVRAGGNANLVGSDLTAGLPSTIHAEGRTVFTEVAAEFVNHSRNIDTGLLTKTTTTTSIRDVVHKDVGLNGKFALSGGGVTGFTPGDETPTGAQATVNLPDGREMSLAQAVAEGDVDVSGVTGDVDIGAAAADIHEYNRDATKSLTGLGRLAVMAAAAAVTGGLGLTGVPAAMAGSLTSNVTEGVLVEDFDLGDALKDAAFAGASAITSELIQDVIAPHFNDVSPLGPRAGDLFSSQNLNVGTLDTVVQGGMQTAVYGGDLGDNILGNVGGFAQDQAAALTFYGAGEFKGVNGLETGSFGGVLTHQVAGCVAGSVTGAGCKEGAAAAGFNEFLSGTNITPDERNYANQMAAILISGNDVIGSGQLLSITDTADKYNRALHENRAEALSKYLGREITDAEFDRADFWDLPTHEREALIYACWLERCDTHLDRDDPTFAQRNAMMNAYLERPEYYVYAYSNAFADIETGGILGIGASNPYADPVIAYHGDDLLDDMRLAGIVDEDNRSQLEQVLTALYVGTIGGALDGMEGLRQHQNIAENLNGLAAEGYSTEYIDEVLGGGQLTIAINHANANMLSVFGGSPSVRNTSGVGKDGRAGSATNRIGRNDSTIGSVGDANFAQTSIRSDREFSSNGPINGQQIYSDLVGYPIRTVDDLSDALRRGDISPADVPVDFVDINGVRLITNTRTSTALQNAGIPRSEWYGTQRTGQVAYTDANGIDITFDDLARNQLSNNGLPSTGSPTLPTGQ